MVTTVVHASATACGATAGVKTLLNGTTNVVMPSWARSIVKITPYTATDSITANLSTIVKFSLESDDVAITPFEVFSNPEAGFDQTDGAPYHAKLQDYYVHCPLKGGEEIKVYGTALTSYTGDVYAGCTLTVSDQKFGRQRFSKVGTYTGTGTGAAEVPGTAYTIHGSERLIEVYGVISSIVLAAEDMKMGTFRISSNDFKVAVPLKWGCNPISGCIGTVDGPYLNPPTRKEVDIPTNTTCTLTDYFYNDITLTAGQWGTGAAFYKVGRA